MLRLRSKIAAINMLNQILDEEIELDNLAYKFRGLSTDCKE